MTALSGMSGSENARGSGGMLEVKDELEVEFAEFDEASPAVVE